jgi:hypothetical protein
LGSAASAATIRVIAAPAHLVASWADLPSTSIARRMVISPPPMSVHLRAEPPDAQPGFDCERTTTLYAGRPPRPTSTSWRTRRRSIRPHLAATHVAAQRHLPITMLVRVLQQRRQHREPVVDNLACTAPQLDARERVDIARRGLM